MHEEAVNQEEGLTENIPPHAEDAGAQGASDVESESEAPVADVAEATSDDPELDALVGSLETQPEAESITAEEPVAGETSHDEPADEAEAEVDASDEPVPFEAEPESEAEPQAADEPAPVEAEPDADAPVEAEPETAAVASADAPVADESGADAPRPARIPAWPFWLHAATWSALVGFAAYALMQTPDVPTYRQDIYPAVVLGGVVMAALGPVLALSVWLAVWSNAPEGERSGLFSSAFLRASAITLFGVLAWWGMLVLVDALRLGLLPF